MPVCSATYRAGRSVGHRRTALVLDVNILVHRVRSPTIANRTAIPERLATAFRGDPAQPGERLTAASLAVWEDADTGPIPRATVRTALTSERSAGLLREILASRISTELATG